MAQPRLPRCRRKPPASAPRTMDLLGVGKDRGLYLWQAALQVLPVSRFERSGAGIVCGHYVLEWDNKAVTVHCSNLADGRIGIQFMCGGLPDYHWPRKTVETLLIGKVIPDPVAAAELSRLLREATEALHDRHTAPHLRRGSL